MYVPRIKCLDCPGKLYIPGPGTGVNNFEVHLKNRIHREKLLRRGKDDLYRAVWSQIDGMGFRDEVIGVKRNTEVKR